jgi:hypothetical protein
MALALVLSGCDERSSTPQQVPAGKPKLAKPPAQAPASPNGGIVFEEVGGAGVRLVCEAEDGKVEAPMQVFTDAKPPAGTDGPKGASGGKYVETPEPTEIDPATNKKKELLGGSTTVTFDIPADGKYCIWLRVWWRHSCANSFAVQRDDDAQNVDTVTDNTEGRWHWVAIGKSIFEPTPFRFTKGQHAAKVISREDGSVLDQVLIVDDPDYRPVGPERAAAKPAAGG